MRLVFYTRPVPKPRMTRRDKWAKRPCVVAYRAYKDALKKVASERNFKLPAVLHMNFYLAMPKSWSVKKRKEMWGMPHQQKPDLDNLIKGFQDAFTDEDGYVYRFKECGKYWGEIDYIEIVYEEETGERPTRSLVEQLSYEALRDLEGIRDGQNKSEVW